MNKTLIFVIAVLIFGGIFMYDFYLGQIEKMQHSVEHMIHRH
jgi:hypothetical protein